ncbi:MAG TPA: hypothetical protein VFE07_16060 [Marmoricola sp.]|nr:hypothetical protein [Marmoricola sp.]
MSTTTQRTQQPTSTSTEVPTTRRTRTSTDVPRLHHGRTAFTIVSLVAAGGCVAALWIGVGRSADVQAPGPTPVRGSSYSGSATAAEHRVLQDAARGESTPPYVGSATAAEHRVLQDAARSESTPPYVGSATAAEHRVLQER